MSDPITVLLVDPDVHARARIAQQLATLTPNIVQAADGATALAVLGTVDIRVVVSELYVGTGDYRCLLQAVRANRALRRTRLVVHTHRNLPQDRDWAMTAGADAFLIKPTRAERLRYVVGRVGSVPGRAVVEPAQGDIVRRDSLDAALAEIEQGQLRDVSSIIFGRRWWQQLPKPQQSEFRRRARQAHVTLRSDSLMKSHFVEVRGTVREQIALSSEQPESPYRR